MRVLSYVAAAALLTCASTLGAQSLEESYANLCSDASMKQGETCAALRKAMLEKLSAEDRQTPQRGAVQSPAPAPQHSDTLALPVVAPAASPPVSPAVSPSVATMAALSSDQTPLDPRWGVLARLVGTQWASEDVGDKKDPKLPRVYRHFASFSFLDGGEALEIQDGVELTKVAPMRIIVLRPTSKSGIFDGEIRQPQVDKLWKVRFRTDETGAVVSDWYKVIDATGRLREMHARMGYRLMPDGTLAQVGASGWEKDRPPLRDPNDPAMVKHRLRAYAASDLPALIQEQIASYPDIMKLQKQNEAMQRQNEAFRAQMQQQRAARKASSNGLLGALVGAAVGAYAGTAAGLDTSQVAGAMMKGMSVTAPQSALAGALGSTGTQLLTGASSASALAGGLGGAPAGGASYPTRPNLAIGACSGFTEANYRTKALKGGGDSQLNTMCGQAFEYYAMYKRAIAQGYSEADANRTYAAHEQSARVASGYRSSHSAN